MSRWLAPIGAALLLAQLHEATAFVVLPLAGAATIAVAAGMARRAPALSGADRAWLLFLAAYALATAAGGGALASTIPTVGPALALYLLLTRADSRARRLVAIALVAVALSESLVVLACAVLEGAPERIVAAARLTWLVTPNDIAVAACCLPYAWELAPRRWIAWSATAIVLLACVALASRTALLALLAAIAAGSMLRFRPRPRRALLFAALAGAASIAIVGLKGGASLDVRLGLWAAALDLWRDHPWLGVGPHAFARHYEPYLAESARALDPRLMPWPHDLPLEILAETGAIGLLAALAAALGFAGRLGRAPRRVSRPACAAAAAFAVAALLDASLLRLWVWNVLALVTAGAGIARGYSFSRGRLALDAQRCALQTTARGGAHWTSGPV